MRKFLLIGAVAVVALGALFLASTLTGSDGVAHGNGAIVVTDHGCVFFDGDGGLVQAEKTHLVVTPSNHGTRVIKCSAKGVANSTGKAVHYDADNNPFGPGVVTCGNSLNWWETVSASGNATLTCLFPQGS